MIQVSTAAVGRSIRLLTLAGGVVTAVAQDMPDKMANAAAEHRAMHRLKFPGNPPIESAAFAPDGESLFVHVVDQAVNVWEILVYCWPEILGAVTAATVVICSIALLRIIRRKRTVGAPYCRRCNYRLTGCTSGRCPECGRPADRPILGRRMCRRTLPFVLPLAITSVGYGSLWILGVPRAGYVATWVNWWSYDLHNRAWDKGVSLARWLRQVDRILEVDVESGRTRRTLITRPNGRQQSCPLIVTPDGSGLLMTMDGAVRLALVSTRSGSVMRTLAYGDSASMGSTRWKQIAGFDDAGRTAYVVLLNEPEKKTVLLAWDLRSGKSSKLLEVDADMASISAHPRKTAWARRLYRVPATRPERFLEWKNSKGGERGADPEIIVRDGKDLQRVVARFGHTIAGWSSPSFTSDGRQVYLRGRGSKEGFTGFELETGQALPALHAPPLHFVYYQNTSVFRHGWVITTGSWHLQGTQSSLSPLEWDPGRPTGFLIGDLNKKRWIGRFVLPSDDVSYHDAVASLDGRFFAASGVFHKFNGADGRNQQELLIYDLRSLPHILPD